MMNGVLCEAVLRAGDAVFAVIASSDFDVGNIDENFSKDNWNDNDV